MSRQISELETILQQLVVEHGKLLRYVEAQQAAMKSFDLSAMDDALAQQEASRLRIVAMENKRRAMTQQLGKLLKLPGEPRIPELARFFPQKSQSLLALRAELKDLMAKIATRTHVSGRIAGAVAGHLNTVVRLLAGAVERAGLYTKNGVPKVSARIGMMEAVG